MTVHLLTGEHVPGTGGVGDYTRLLAAALSLRGITVRIWDTADPRLRSSLPDALRADAGYVLLQYVPNALGARGANLRFCLWLLSLRRAGVDVRVMFHEPYFYFSWNPLLNGLALVQRAMAAVLLRAASHAYISTEQWQRYLSPYAPHGTAFTVLPVPSTIPPPDAALVVEWRRRFGGSRNLLAGHFGTYGDHVAKELEPLIPALLRQFEGVHFVCIGRGGDSFAAQMRSRYPHLKGRLLATGALADAEASAAVAACDIAVQPYPDGVTTRRTSIMAPLSLGVATVTSRGFLTEPIWTEASAVLLAPASDSEAHADRAASLLRDAGMRGELASRGRAVYDAQFSMERTVDTLLRVAAGYPS